MAKKGRKKKEKVSIDVAVVSMILISVLLAVLIYTKSGVLGEHLSPALGGIMGFIKYIIPIGTFAIAIYLAYEKKETLIKKLFQYTLFLVCIAIMLSVFQISAGNIGIKNGMNQIIEQAYYLGERDIGGGVIGTVIAVPLINFLGTLGTIVLSIGIGIITFVFMFAIKPTEIIYNIVDYLVDKKEEKKQLREEERKSNRKLEKEEQVEEITPKRETLRERKLREKEEARRRALEIDEEQLSINLNGLEEEIRSGKLKKYNHDKDDLTPLGMAQVSKRKMKMQVPDLGPDLEPEPELELEPEQVTMPKKQKLVENQIESSPDELGNLFKQQIEEKEEKVKEVLNLEHTMAIEEENETYEFPPIEMLKEGNKTGLKGGKRAVADTATRLQKTLYSFGVSAKVENVSVGPAITRYELKPAEGVRVNKIANLADDIALNLAAESIRIEAPIPGKHAVGIEVPNTENEVVHLRDIIDTTEFEKHESNLAFALGKDVAGKAVVADIAKMPHVMIAGATGSGKSVCINTLITSIIYKSKPSDAKLVMIDPKVVELSVYNGIPHLLIPVVTDPRKAAGALAWAVQEMENRYATFAAKGVRDLKGYNQAVAKTDGIGKLPHIVIIIDELADLMMVAKKDVEDAICRLAQKARAAGMHLVIATQRPSVDVITGLIKANIPSRVAFAVSSQVDSRTILDMVGAEKLLGKGDMLFYPAGAPKPTRIQGAFISDSEVESIVNFLKANGEVTYNEDIIESIENSNKTDKEIAQQAEEDDDDTDPFLMDAIDVVVETGQASTSFIQRRFKVGYARAGRIIDQMEERGVISGYQGSKPREVLMTKERLAELKMGATGEAHVSNEQIEE